MQYFRNVLETIGHTPLIQLNKVVSDVPGLVLAKVETTNPGNSAKDRIAAEMIDEAERLGKLKPGGTVIECTSGNTGMGLSIVSVVKGYRCIFTTTEKQSQEKISILRALGAEVIICPTDVAPEHPSSYYSVAKRLSQEIPNSYWCNQYENPANTQAHYRTTGPEIWEQTQGKITHFIVGIGTGGTISGVSRFLKQQNPAIKVWGVDPYGSSLKHYHETGKLSASQIYGYSTEGIGQDIIPSNVDFQSVDFIEKVTCKDAALMTRALARDEGILVGYSSGAALAGLLQLKDRLKPDDVVVILFHDHASRYLGKVFNDTWMKEQGFLESSDSMI